MHDSQAEYDPAEEPDERQSTDEQEWYVQQDKAYEEFKQDKVDFMESARKVL